MELIIEKMARAQFRLDTNCALSYEKEYRIMINPRADLDGARVVEGMSSFCRIIIFEGDAYIMADPAILPWIREKYEKSKPEWFCKYENLRTLDRKLNEYGYEIADTHVYFLPKEGLFAKIEEPEKLCLYELKWLADEEIEGFRKENPWPHALTFSSTQPDVLAIAAMDEGEIIGMAGASSDGKYLWQIGIDIAQDYEGLGLASFLVSLVRDRILSKGIVPFYGTSESHALSMRVGMKAGFAPAWAEIFVRRISE